MKKALLTGILLLFATMAWAEGDFSFSEVNITPLTGNIYRCAGTVTNNSSEFYQGACFNLHISDMNGKRINTLMFCIDRIDPHATRDYQLDFENVVKQFQYNVEFLTKY